MTKLTRVHAVGYTDMQGKKEIDFARLDPRFEDGETLRSYKRFTTASASRVSRLLSGDNVRMLLFPDRLRISRQYARSRHDWKFGQITFRWIGYGCE